MGLPNILSFFSCHELIYRHIFADSYSSWQKGAIENANKIIRQYIPKGTYFSTLTDTFIRIIQHKINRRSRNKL